MRFGLMRNGRGTGDGLPELFTTEEWADLARRYAMSPRQRQIARLICLGHSNRSIGERLGLKPDTIRMHNRELFRKLAVRERIGVAIRLVVSLRSSVETQGREE